MLFRSTVLIMCNVHRHGPPVQLNSRILLHDYILYILCTPDDFQDLYNYVAYKLYSLIQVRTYKHECGNVCTCRLPVRLFEERSSLCK